MNQEPPAERERKRMRDARKKEVNMKSVGGKAEKYFSRETIIIKKNNKKNGNIVE